MGDCDHCSAACLSHDVPDGQDGSRVGPFTETTIPVPFEDFGGVAETNRWESHADVELAQLTPFNGGRFADRVAMSYSDIAFDKHADQGGKLRLPHCFYIGGCSMSCGTHCQLDAVVPRGIDTVMRLDPGKCRHDVSQFRGKRIVASLLADDLEKAVSRIEVGEHPRFGALDVCLLGYVGGVLPLLVETPAGYVAIAESDLLDWAGFSVTGTGAAAVKVTLDAREDGKGLVVSSVPRVSPWRVLMFGRTAMDLVGSDLIATLATPCRLQDISWIKPGACAWDAWWTGINPHDPNPRHRNVEARGTTPSHKEYIDFAAEMGWPYQLMDWYWYEGMTSYMKSLHSPPNPVHGDFRRPVPEINVPELMQYAKVKNVRLLIWAHSLDIETFGVDDRSVFCLTQFRPDPQPISRALGATSAVTVFLPGTSRRVFSILPLAAWHVHKFPRGHFEKVDVRAPRRTSPLR